MFDIRMTSGPVQKLLSTQNTPVHSLQYVKPLETSNFAAMPRAKLNSKGLIAGNYA
jgi:hypothetical protein